MKQGVSRLSTGSLEHGNSPGFVAIAATSCSMENTSLELVVLAPLGVRVMEDEGGLSGRSRRRRERFTERPWN